MSISEVLRYSLSIFTDLIILDLNGNNGPSFDLGNTSTLQQDSLINDVPGGNSNSPYQDLDGKDTSALHMLGKTEKGEIIATARILIENPGKVIVGRVVVDDNYRKYGIGKELMKQTISDINRLMGNVQINISAQKYLLNFYTYGETNNQIN